MSIGEPQHTPPAIYWPKPWPRRLWPTGVSIRPPPARPITALPSPPGAQSRYGLPAGFLDPERHILPIAGSREGLFMAAQLCVPPQKNGHAPTVLMPNPFYQVYFGAAVMNGAAPVYVATAKATGFQPDYAAVAAADLDRAAMAYLCTPANPQGTVASLDRLKDVITSRAQARLRRGVGRMLLGDLRRRATRPARCKPAPPWAKASKTFWYSTRSPKGRVCRACAQASWPAMRI